MDRKKLFLVFPDGVGIRNYLYSNVFDDTHDDLILFHNLDSEAIEYINSFKKTVKTIEIPDYSESVSEKFLRELISLSRLYYNTGKVNNPTILENWKWKQKTISKKLFYKIIEVLAPFNRKYSAILKMEKVYQRWIRKTGFYDEIIKILQKEKPDSIFCAHQRGLKMATVFAAAKDLKIPTATTVFSWDNLPKARMALRADEYWVWSEYMKKEIEIYYPEIPQKSIIIKGAPQFDFYSDERNIIGKEDFFSKYNLDVNRKIICFSGDDELTSPDDPKYLHDLAEELLSRGFENKYQILLRRCPVDVSGRFDTVVKKFPDLIKVANPLWNFNPNSSWTTVYPTFDDVKLLVSTAYYCDMVVNVGSTMAFDFSMFEKPCVFINYDQEKKTNDDWSVKTIYQFQHFRSMPNKNAVIWWNSKSDFINLVSEAENKKYSTCIQEWRDIVLGVNLETKLN